MSTRAAADSVIGHLAGRIARLARGRTAAPVIVALDGPVAVGKTSLAANLADALRRRDLSTTVVGADGFLLPLVRLDAAGLIPRKGFPESFDRAAMAAFLSSLRRGEARAAPAYAHDLYDVSPDRQVSTAGAAVVVLEGVNVLQPDLAQLYDLRLYLDADPALVRAWFIQRFGETAFTPERTRALAPWRPADGRLDAWAAAVWNAINAPNLERHISAGRARADVILRAHPGHELTLGGEV